MVDPARGDPGRTVAAHVDLDALRHNFDLVRTTCADSRVMAVIKANAYGHGAISVAHALPRADGFAVARLSEAIELRSAGVMQRILLLGSLLRTEELTACAARNIDVTVHDEATLAAVTALPPATELNVWLKLDSGMHRVGLSADHFVEADRQLRRQSNVGEVVHMTHFSSADAEDLALTAYQLAYFQAAHRVCGPAAVSLANSAALLRLPDARGDWVRPGILLYGGRAYAAQAIAVRPAMRLMAKVVAVRDLSPGERVGYHGRWASILPSRIATVGAGYADGYPRHARDGTPVLVNGRIARLAGRVSMDFLTIDVSQSGSVTAGDEVELWGPAIAAADVADASGTIDYHLWAGLPERVSRQYGAALSNGGDGFMPRRLQPQGISLAAGRLGKGQ